MKSIRQRLAMTGLCLALVGGCVAVPPKPPAFTAEMPARFQFAGTVDRPRDVRADWWTLLRDPMLDELIAWALVENLGLRAANARLAAARARRGTVPGALTGTGSASANGELELGSGDVSTTVGAQLSLEWLFDLGGRRAVQRARSENAVDLAQAQLGVARLAVLEGLLVGYIDLRFREAQVDLLERDVARRRQALEAQRERIEAGTSTVIDTQRIRAQLAEAQARLPPARAGVAVARNRLTTLAGLPPGALDGFLTAGDRPIPDPTGYPDLGIPADLLRGRPDVILAERSYYDALLEVSAQRAALYPSLTLGGVISADADATRLGLGPTLQLPILPLAQTRAGISAAEEAAQAAFLEWRQTVLEAIAAVENAMLTYRAATEALPPARESVALTRRALALTNEVVDGGEMTTDAVIDAQDAVSRAVLALTSQRRDRAAAYVDLLIRAGVGGLPGLAARGASPT